MFCTEKGQPPQKGTLPGPEHAASLATRSSQERRVFVIAIHS